MLPDKFGGRDGKKLAAKARDVLKAAHAAAKPLRTTIISEDWKEERVVEYTDTTKTQVRYRVTRSVTAQVAGKVEDDVFLYTIHLAQDRKADGKWGLLHGHVMFTDAMLEANVKK